MGKPRSGLERAGTAAKELCMFVETLTDYVLAVNDFLYRPYMVPLVLLVVGAGQF